MSATVRGYAFFVSGTDTSNAFTLSMYDPTAGIWSALLLPHWHLWPAAVGVKDLLVVAGGVDLMGTDSTDSVDVFNVTSRIWSYYRLSQPRGQLAAVVVRDCVLFAGGMVNQTEPSCVVDVWNVTSNTWFSSLTTPSLVQNLSLARGGLGGGSTGIAVFYGGGGGTAATTNAVDTFGLACSLDADCDDGEFCNGQETCSPRGVCINGSPPCRLWDPCKNNCHEQNRWDSSLSFAGFFPQFCLITRFRTCFNPQGWDCSTGFCTGGAVCDGVGSCVTMNVCKSQCMSVCQNGACAPDPAGTPCDGRGISACDGITRRILVITTDNTPMFLCCSSGVCARRQRNL